MLIVLVVVAALIMWASGGVSPKEIDSGRPADYTVMVECVEPCEAGPCECGYGRLAEKDLIG